MAKHSSLSLKQGEILRILVARSERKAPDLANDLGLSDYTYLSKLYKKKMLPDYVIKNACAVFDYEESVFNVESLEELANRVGTMESRINILEKEKNHLQTEVALLNARLEECERKKGILEAKTN